MPCPAMGNGIPIPCTTTYRKRTGQPATPAGSKNPRPLGMGSVNHKEEPVSYIMERAREEYFNLPKEERKGIKWNGELLRIAIFEDKYLAQCKKEGRVPDKNISKHFWNICVNNKGYEPEYCAHIDRDERERTQY